MGEDFAIFLTSFQKYEKFVLDAKDTLILLERYNDEYNKTGKMSSENINDMEEKFFNFVKDLIKIVYDDGSGSLFTAFIKSVAKEKNTIKSGVELLIVAKNYFNGDAGADEMIDVACNCIEVATSKLPIIGYIVGPLFGDAAKVIFNSVEEESEALNNNSDLIQHFLDKIHQKDYHEEYNTYLLNNEILPEVSQGGITQLGDGTILIPSFQGNSVIRGTSDNDTIKNSDSVVIYGLGGNDSIKNSGKDVTVYAGIGDDTVSNISSSYNAIIFGGAGNDSIINSGDSVTIDAGDNDDYIENYFVTREVSVNGGAGNDSIINMYGLKNTLIGGEGNDLIENSYGKKSRIFGGEGNDTINNKAAAVTINGGTGDDLIVLSSGAKNNLIVYEADNGNDEIQGFTINSTLKIGNGADNYSKEISGNDIIITVGNEKITLIGVKNLSYVNIQGTEISLPKWTLNGSTAAYGDTTKTVVTVDGVKSLEGIELRGTTVSIGRSALNNATVTISDGYTLALGSDVEKTSMTAAKWTGNGSTFTYTATSTSAGYKLYDNKISYITASGGEQFTLTGLKDTSAVTVSGKVVIIGKDSLNGENVTITNGYTLALDGVNAPTTVAAQWYGTTYKSEYISSAGYEASGNKITYTPATNPIELFSLSGVDSADGFDVSKNGDNYIVNISNLSYDASKTITLNKKSSNVRFAYADNFAGNTVQTIAQAASLNNGTYTSTTYQPWSELDDDALTIYPATTAKTFTISGLGNGAKLGTNVVISENKITISNGALNNTHEKISVSDPSYTLEVTASPIKAIAFAQNGNKVTLSGKTAGYKEVNGEYVWQEQIGGESLTITGLKSNATLTADMFTRSGNVITFKPTDTVIPDEPTVITISNGVIDTSALSTTDAIDAHWSGTTYISAKTASSWTTGTSSVSYTPAAGGEELFTIDGLKSVNGITPTQNGNSYKVTLPATAFDKSGTITVTKKSAAATLEFEGIGTTTEPVEATLTKGGVYRAAHTSEHFATSTSGDTTTYTYTAAKNDCGFTISGLNLSNDISGTTIDEYFTFNNGTVTVKKLGTNNITLNNIDADGNNDDTADITIKLALEKDVVQVANTLNTGVALIKSGNDYVYTSAGYKSWYELSDTKITYHPATGGETLFTISGLGTATLGENIIVDGTTVKVSDSALAQKNVSITGDYTLTLNNVSTPLPVPAHFDGLTYKRTSNTAGYTIADNGKLISYKAAGVASDLFTLTGIKTTDGITVDGNVVTLKEDNLNGENVTITGNDYKLNLSNDVTKPSTTAAGWSLSDTTAIYKNAATSSGYKLADNKISYVKASGGETLATVTGVKSLDGVSLNGNVVTVSNAALNQGSVTISDGYTLALASNVAIPIKTNAGWSPVSSEKAIYNFESTTAGYTLTDNKINYIKATPAKSFMLSGIKSTNGISIDGTTVTLSAANLDKKTVAISDGYTLALAEDVSTSATENPGAFTNFANGTATFTTNSSDDFYTLNGNKISYTAATTGQSITIKGLAKNLRLNDGELNGITAETSNGITTFKISESVLTDSDVTITGDNCKLELDGYTAPKEVPASFVNGVYTQAHTPAHYTATDEKISYVKASDDSKFTITGLVDDADIDNGFTVDDKTVTLSEDALNDETVTLTTNDGYTLAVDSSVRTKATTTKAAWTKKNSTFTYTAPITSDFYTIKGNTLNYTAKKGGEQFTLTGLKNTNAVTVSGKKVTIDNASLDGKALTLTGDYTLALAKDVTTSSKKTTGAFTTVSKGTATYKTTSFSGYYKVSGKKISYTAQTGGQSITIKNLNTATKLSALKSGITVAEQSNGSYKITFKNSAVLTTKAPTVSAEKGLKYTVAVADSLKPVTKSAWTISGTTATFRATTTAGYTVNSKNAVVYTAQKNGSPLLELTGLAKGVKASSIAAPKNKVITLKADVLGAKTSVKSNGGGYTLNLTGNMNGKKFTGTGKVDTLTIAANNASIDLGAGNDVVTVSGLKVTLNGGNGNDKLTGSKNVDLIYGGAGNDSILGNAANDKLYGDAGNDSLRGGAGANTLTGGKGDDKLWGDAGKDTFLYSNGDGKDIIFGFENNDLLQITGTFSTSYNKSKKEIAFKVGSTANAITLKDFTATSFHINGDTYDISGTKLVKK